MDSTAAAAAALAQAQGTISSRFVSQDAVDEAKARQAEEWKAAYARIGQEPPPQDPEEVYDGRTLYERLNSQKEAKREEWDDKMKLSNQYRGLETEELQFLAEKARERKAAERLVEQAENAEVREYREALAAKNAAAVAAAAALPIPSGSGSSSTSTFTSSTRKLPPKSVKKDVKSLLKGVVVKKKSKPVEVKAAPAKDDQKPTVAKTPDSEKATVGEKRRADGSGTDGEEKEDEKRRKVEPT